MKTYESSPLAQYPTVAAVSRWALAVGVVGLFAAASITAGPGNGYQPPAHAAADVVHVTLPQVVVVGRREAASPSLSVASAATEVRSADGSGFDLPVGSANAGNLTR